MPTQVGIHAVFRKPKKASTSESLGRIAAPHDTATNPHRPLKIALHAAGAGGGLYGTDGLAGTSN
jgi:hypothetical protein